jgi:hypothetical protein
MRSLVCWILGLQRDSPRANTTAHQFMLGQENQTMLGLRVSLTNAEGHPTQLFMMTDSSLEQWGRQFPIYATCIWLHSSLCS